MMHSRDVRRLSPEDLLDRSPPCEVPFRSQCWRAKQVDPDPKGSWISDDPADRVPRREEEEDLHERPECGGEWALDPERG
jgi:hypothetical protein